MKEGRLGKALEGRLEGKSSGKRSMPPPLSTPSQLAPSLTQLKSHMVVCAGTALWMHAAFSVSRSQAQPPDAHHFTKVAGVAIRVSASAPRQTPALEPGSRQWERACHQIPSG